MKSFLVFGLLVVAFSAPAAPNVQVTTVTSSSITVTWSVTESEGVIAYRVVVSEPNSGYIHENEVDVSAHETTVRGLASAAPSVQVTTVTSSSITVTWSVTESEGVIAYRVVVSEPNSGYIHENEVDVSAHETTVRGLDPDTEYEVRVMAVKDYGYQGVVGVITSTTAPAARSLPHVRLTSVTSSSITVTWSGMESEGVTAYRVMVSEPNSGRFYGIEVAAGTHGTTIEHLEPDTDYELQVTPETLYGLLTSSEILTVKTTQ